MTLSLMPPAPIVLANSALFFDVDGTLVGIEQEPSAVKVSDELRGLLARLIEVTDGALALVSGRSVEQLDGLFKPLSFSASGLHGIQRRMLPGPLTQATDDQAALQSAKQELEVFAKTRPGVFVEDKGLTLALHYRMAPEHHETAARCARKIVENSQGTLVLLEGKMVLEMKPPGFDKGRAIADFMQEPLFSGRCPVFAGDDVTDEAGFTAVNDMGGVSIKVGTVERVTDAKHGLGSVQAMSAWLQDLVVRHDGSCGDSQ